MIMSKNYQDIVDLAFHKNYPHRSLRTVFDPFSTEWKQTSMEKKIEILFKTMETGDYNLNQLVEQYKDYYLFELENKSHVVKSVEDALIRITEYLLNENMRLTQI